MSIAVITDSTAYLPERIAEQYHIYNVSLNVLFEGIAYKEIEELSTRDFYERMRSTEVLPTTSQPTIGDYVTLLEQLKSEGVTDVIAIHLSSGISGTYQSAVATGDMVEGINVHAIDSEISCLPQGFLAIRAAEMASSHTVAEIITEMNAMKEDMIAYFLVDDLKNLQKGGRLTGAQAFIGSMLQVKPILKFVDTKIVPYEKVRTKKKAIKRIESLIQDFVNKEDTLTACILHANDLQTAEAWKTNLEKEFPNTNFIIGEFGPVIGTHLGEHALGFGIVKRQLNI